MFAINRRSVVLALTLLILGSSVMTFGLRMPPLTSASLDGSNHPGAHSQTGSEMLHRSPVVFVENVGQYGESARFSEFAVQKQAEAKANEVLIFSDFFDVNTLADYRIVNSVTWQPSVQDVHLGGGVESDHRLYKALWFSHDFTIRSRLYIPSSGIGPFDTIAIAIRREDVEYWATLAYGTDLGERNHIGFIRNDSWGDLYPLTLTPGWYTVKVQASYEERILRMKAWSSNNEPGWQVSIPLNDGWSATEIGFRHFGKGTEVDNLQIFAPEGKVQSAALDGRIYCKPSGGGLQALSGVPVKLYTNDGRLFDSQTSDSGGYYGLCNWLVQADSQYKLEVCWQGVCRTETVDAMSNQCRIHDFNMCADVATPTPTASSTATSPPTATDTLFLHVFVQTEGVSIQNGRNNANRGQFYCDFGAELAKFEQLCHHSPKVRLT